MCEPADSSLEPLIHTVTRYFGVLCLIFDEAWVVPVECDRCAVDYTWIECVKVGEEQSSLLVVDDAGDGACVALSACS